MTKVYALCDTILSLSHMTARMREELQSTESFGEARRYIEKINAVDLMALQADIELLEHASERQGLEGYLTLRRLHYELRTVRSGLEDVKRLLALQAN